MAIPKLPKPPEDFRIWVDGSYRDGVGGYGIVVRPGDKEMCGGRPVANSTEAERLAVEQALAIIPKNTKVIIYSDCRAVVDELKKRKSKWITVRYMPDFDPQLRRAHKLANKGRKTLQP